MLDILGRAAIFSDHIEKLLIEDQLLLRERTFVQNATKEQYRFISSGHIIFKINIRSAEKFNVKAVLVTLLL